MFKLISPCLILVFAIMAGNASAHSWRHGHTNSEPEFVNGDPRPDAPELAYRGEYDVGVRTLNLVNPDQVDIKNYSAGNPEPRYDRPLKVEVWYPARLRHHQKQLTYYHDSLGSGPGNPDRPVTPFKFKGRAARNARTDVSQGPYPLIIVSHGHPGSRVLLSYLTENLASKGYVVAAIDHTDSTHADSVSFNSTLVNRPLDINFVLDTIANKGSSMSYSFLRGMVDASSTALIGYSMGGYGSLIAAGAGITLGGSSFVPGGYLSKYIAGTQEYADFRDPRIAAVVLFAPWGGSFGVWNAQGLAGMTVPSLFVVGDMDRTAPYAGVQFLFDNAASSDRYMLLYRNGIHEVAVNPTPPEAYENYAEFIHYQEPAWDNKRTNNVNQHFVTAFLGMHLKSIDGADYGSYINMVQPIANLSPRTYGDGSDPAFWKGFTDWTPVGLELPHVQAN